MKIFTQSLKKSKNSAALFMLAFACLWGNKSWGQNVSATWGANSNTAWYTGGNWAGGSYAGSQGAAASNSNIATFTNAFTGTTPGINMGTASLNLGAISIENTRSTNLNIGNSSATAGSLRLYGTTVNSVANVIVRHNGTGTFTLQAAQNGTMGVVLSNATNNIINIDNTGGITISSVLSGSGNLTKAGAGTGILTLTGSNTYSGTTTITSGELRINPPAANLSLTGGVVLNGGNLATTGITASRTATFGTLTLSENATIALQGNAHTLTFSASNGVSWTSAKTLTITGWTGTVGAGTTGTAGKIFVGSNSSGLTASQLAQIKFTISGINYPATILSTGEIVPTLKYALGSITPGSPTAGASFSVTVSAVDFDGTARNVVGGSGSSFSLTTNGNGGTIGGTTTGTIATGTSSVVVSGVTLSTAGTGATLTATRTAGDVLLTGTSAAFDVSATGSPFLTITGTPTNHGSVCPGFPATTVQYTITNSGTVQADGISVSSNDAQFGVSGLSGTSIAASGGTVTYNVTFTPSSAGAKSATITVTSTTSGSNSPTSSLTGTGTTTVAQAVSSAAATSVTASSATLNGNVTTLGICPATTEKGFVYSVTATNNDPFEGGTGVTKTAVGSPSTGTYNLPLSSLSPSTQYSFKAYVYNGTSYTYGAVQTFTTSDAFSISGTATHGTVCPGVSASSITYTITNTSNLVANGVNVVSSDPQFVVSGLSSTTIAASGGTATFSVTFTPASAGAQSSVLSATSTTPGITTATYNISGTGTTPVTPVVVTNAASAITVTTATLNGSITTLGVCPATTSKGFVYSLTSANNDPVNGGTGVTTTPVSGVATGGYTLGLTGLSGSTSYSYKAYVFDGTTYTYGALQTFTTVASSVTVANTGTPATGNVAIGTNNVILFGFSLTPNTSVDFTAASIGTSGTATSSDLSNFRLIYDANSNGAADAGEISSPLGTVATLANPLVFSGISGQTGFSAVRRYLLIADAAGGATGGNTFTGSLTGANTTTTASSNTGTASGNVMTLAFIASAGEILINQVNGGYSSASNEYIELVNRTNKTFDLSTLKIVYYSASGSANNTTVGTLSGTLLPHSFWLLGTGSTVNVGLTSSLASDATFTGGLAQAGGQLSLQRTSDNAQIDGVAYGTITSNVVAEGSPVAATFSAPAGGIIRVTDGVDNNTNSTDFTTVANGSIYLRNSTGRLGNSTANIAAASYRDLVITGNSSLGGNVTVTGLLKLTSGNLSIGANTLTLNGAVSRTGGFLAGSNTSGLTVNAAAGNLFFATGGTNNYLNAFTIGASGSATLGNALNITAWDGTAEGVLTVTSGGTLNTGGFLAIKSNSNGTARIAAGNTAGNYISGNVSVERFIPQNSSKGWRLLASNTNGTQTINQAWQEGGIGGMVDPNPGFGTKITRNAANLAATQALGFDTLSPGASLFKYNPATDGLEAVSNTNNTVLSSEPGYFLFIRGDRSPGQFGAGAPTTSTILRSFGSVFQGNQTAVTTGAFNYALVRNPYASRIDMRSIVRSGLLVDAFQVWDPKLGGSFGVGAYQTFTKSGSDYVVTPGFGSYGAPGSAQNFIESGAAFFIQSSGGSGSAQVTEACKTSASSNASFRPSTPAAGESRLSFSLFANNAGNYDVVDGGLVFFGNTYANEVTVEDVRKSSNFNENFGMLRNNAELVVEKRQQTNLNDTIFFSMNQLRQIGYRLDVEATNIDPLITTAILEDRYTNTSTSMNLATLNSYNFTVDANAASKAADRFRIVFRQSGVVPVSFITVKAAQSGRNISVEWKVANETNTIKYEVEKSTDGRTFSGKATVSATNKGTYNWLDENVVEGYNYYRIRSVDNNGAVKFAQIVKVQVGGKASIAVSPNPVQGNFVNIQFAQQPAGKYGIQITNITGQVVYNKEVTHNGGSASQSFVLPSSIISGVYHLKVIAPDNTNHIEKLVVSQGN